ncbi:hypothetical protein J3A64_004702 [Pseudarthrobacter sp. PvP004]|uniref:hypothetical protein n=1 Tax=Pseudarthrobacter sp. PvP004 TaxID=2817850 RepID=UPI001AEA6E33|nr:hypothetical protein [Pseudarthrobacter sp. PvP004]MBP2269162.1 hypothetical protein [Pseudarthrobacter sp. PvP004]
MALIVEAAGAQTPGEVGLGQERRPGPDVDGKVVVVMVVMVTGLALLSIPS